MLRCIDFFLFQVVITPIAECNNIDCLSNYEALEKKFRDYQTNAEQEIVKLSLFKKNITYEIETLLENNALLKCTIENLGVQICNNVECQRMKNDYKRLSKKYNHLKESNPELDLFKACNIPNIDQENETGSILLECGYNCW